MWLTNLFARVFNNVLGGWGKTLVLAVILYVLFVGQSNPLALFFRPDLQIVYQEEWVAFDCVRPDFCFMHFRLTIGNLGKNDYDRLEVHYENLPRTMRGWSLEFLHLYGEYTETRRPAVTARRGGGHRTDGIQNLTSGTLMEIELLQKRMPRAEAERLRNLDDYVRIDAPGQVLEGNPRATAFGRYLRAFFGLKPTPGSFPAKSTPRPDAGLQDDTDEPL